MTEFAAYTRLAGVYDEIVVDPCYPLWARFITAAWQDDEAGVHRVLDVCCGTGLMMAELLARGYDVVGMDAAAAMLARARHLLGPDATLIEAVLPDVGTDEVFDAAISTFDGLNYLPPADFRRSIDAIAARVRPGGWLIFDLHTDALMAFTLANPLIAGEEQGYRFAITSDVDPHARSVVTTVDMVTIATGDSFTEQHRQYFHSDEQVRGALADAGFGHIRVTQEYTTEPAGSGTLRATWIARLGP